MVTIKTEDEIKILREGGRRLAGVLEGVAKEVKPGVSTAKLDEIARSIVKGLGDKSAFLNYKPKGAKRPYPAALCVSVNDEVVHGIPGKRMIREGDIVSIDMGLVHDKLVVDSAITIGVGKIDDAAKKLISVTREALSVGIAEAVAGKHIGDIGYAIEHLIRPYKFGIVRELAGHGVGYAVHEDPYVPNFGKRGKGEELRPGMVLAIEPMVNEGSENVFLSPDGYTFHTEDGKRSVHFEHTIVITNGAPEILTKL